MARIALVGATGRIGSRILAEAADRQHKVTAIVRDTGRVPERPGVTALRTDARQQAALAAAMAGHDAAVVSVRWNDNDIDTVIAACRDAALPRTLFVIGAGSLRMPDGRPWFDHMAERGILPPTSASAKAAYERIIAERDLDWTAVSPPADIAPGERTGRFRLGRDDLLHDAEGNSRISFEDFAVGIVDEIERPGHRRQRFTMAY